VEVVGWNLVNEVAVELAQEQRVWQVLVDEVHDKCFLLCLIMKTICDVFLAVNEQVVSSTVQVFKSLLGANAGENTVVNYTNTRAEDVCFFHGVSGQHHGSVAVTLAVLQDVPQLTTGVWIKTCGRLVKEYNFRV